MNHLRAGQFIRYTAKNELGVIKNVIDSKFVRVWLHMGFTSAMIADTQFETLTNDEAFTQEFTNDYARASLIERALRVDEEGDTSDLIDRDDVRPVIYELLKEKKEDI